MITFILILVIVAGVAASLDAIVRDDRGQLPSPGSHTSDPSFTPPSALR